MTNVINISSRLKQSREALGLSQAELAKKAGVSQSTIGNLESGTRKSPKYVLTIATALGVDPMWLQYGSGVQKPLVAMEPPRPYGRTAYDWPFLSVSQEEWESLPNDVKALIDAQVHAAVLMTKNAGAKKTA